MKNFQDTGLLVVLLGTAALVGWALRGREDDLREQVRALNREVWLNRPPTAAPPMGDHQVESTG